MSSTNKLEKESALRDNYHVIIIPGSCSAKTNWFDQIQYFRKLGMQVHFVDLPNTYPTIDDCSLILFNKLSRLKNKLGKDAQQSIVCHSMGGMQTLNILSQRKRFEGINKETYNFIANSKIFFTQVPLKRKPLTLVICNIANFIFYPLMFLYNKYLFLSIDGFIYKLKKAALSNPLIALLNGFKILNHISILNAVLGTAPQTFKNLIKYYADWDFYGHREKSAKCGADSFLENLSKEQRQKYFFSKGGPDLFCIAERTEKFAQDIGAHQIYFANSFHVPMHLANTQEDFHSWVLSS